MYHIKGATILSMRNKNIQKTVVYIMLFTMLVSTLFVGLSMFM
ncbi:stressosome-associated protein Prli42 [Bacillus sp. FJAT-52991]|uniref:Stressosome-associated protein Prli42 n=1 Tax=Bacillus kandeliae TaxID=3129297 RepID=A0ABZ2N3C0_9BACI